MKKKTQIFIMHGGMTFKNKKDYINFLKNRSISLDSFSSWKDEYLDQMIGEDFQIIRPRMPMAENAKYTDWKIHFERCIPLLRDNVILIGNSLGSIFFAKYLSENKFPYKILATYLVCPPFDDTCFEEDLVGGFKLKSNLSLLELNSPNTTLMFSEDDDDVPVEHAEKYRKKLPNSKIIIYKSKNGHFRISKFPEIVKMIKNDLKRLN